MSCVGFDFKEGDIISYADAEFVVIDNYGSCGKVKENYENGDIIDNFYWKIYGEECKLIKRSVL